MSGSCCFFHMFWGVNLGCREWASSLMHTQRGSWQCSWFIWEQRGNLSWLCCCSSVCLLLRSLWGLMRHTHSQLHRDWWWCTASAWWGASSALPDARRAQWLGLTQREYRARETTISSQCTTTSSLPETVPLCSFRGVVSKDSWALLLMLMLFICCLSPWMLNIWNSEFFSCFLFTFGPADLCGERSYSANKNNKRHKKISVGGGKNRQWS